jgi:hypothetical protein
MKCTATRRSSACPDPNGSNVECSANAGDRAAHACDDADCGNDSSECHFAQEDAHMVLAFPRCAAGGPGLFRVLGKPSSGRTAEAF